MLSYYRAGQPGGMYGPVAAATIDGRSLAVLAPGRAEGGMALESYGDPRAGNVLTALLEEWTAQGRPGSADLALEVRFDSAQGPPRVRRRWPQSSTVRARR